MMVLNRNEVTDAFREAVLEALDAAADKQFPLIPHEFRHAQGASDADLPRLFSAIDAQIETLCERYGAVLVDYEVSLPG